VFACKKIYLGLSRMLQNITRFIKSKNKILFFVNLNFNKTDRFIFL